VILETEARIALGGEAIAHAPDGRVVFVTGAAPEEQVEVEITEDTRRFLRARVVRVVRPGAARVDPRCKHFAVCGGCALQHLDGAVQREAKNQAFIETLRRIGRVDPGAIVVEPPWGGAVYGYRSRTRLAFDRGRLGYRAKKSNAIVDVGECPILAPALEAAVLRTRLAIPSRARGEVELMLAGDHVIANSDVELGPIEGVVFTPEASDFRQSNLPGNDALIETIESWLTPPFQRSVIELYAGSGNLTRSLAKSAKSVLAVEASRAPLARAVLPSHVDRRAQAAERAVSELVRAGARFDAALADPPRTGLDATLPAGLAKLGIEALLMVSCDPATFARDVARLAQQGLHLTRARLFDFYPQTGHAEVAGYFALVGPGSGG